MQLPFIHINTCIFNTYHLSTSSFPLLNASRNLKYMKQSEDIHTHVDKYLFFKICETKLRKIAMISVIIKTFIQNTPSSSMKGRFSLYQANCSFDLVNQKLHRQYLTIQSRLQWSYSSHSPDSPDMSSGWHIQLCNLIN